MKNINKIIHWKMIEITLLVSIILISIPLWKKLEIKEYLSTAAFFSKAKYTYLEVDDNQWTDMYPIQDEEALVNLKPTILSVKNETKTKENYTLILKISKSSTLDVKCLNIALNDQISPLKNHFMLEDQDNMFFKLDSSSIIGETKKYNFLMWMDKSTGNEMQNKTLSYIFELQEKVAI